MCPEGHGHVYELDTTGRFYCPHRAHEGYSERHPLGPLAPSSPWFTWEQIAQPRRK